MTATPEEIDRIANQLVVLRSLTFEYSYLRTMDSYGFLNDEETARYATVSSRIESLEASLKLSFRSRMPVVFESPSSTR